MKKRIFEKRAATDYEKATVTTMRPADGKIYLACYVQADALKNIAEMVYPCVYCTKKNGYIPARFRSQNFIIK